MNFSCSVIICLISFRYVCGIHTYSNLNLSYKKNDHRSLFEQQYNALIMHCSCEEQDILQISKYVYNCTIFTTGKRSYNNELTFSFNKNDFFQLLINNLNIWYLTFAITYFQSPVAAHLLYIQVVVAFSDDRYVIM